MWSLGVIVYVLLTLAIVRPHTGMEPVIDSESFGKHLRTGVPGVISSFDISCSVLIPPNGAFVLLIIGGRDNMIPLCIPGPARCPFKAGVSMVKGS